MKINCLIVDDEPLALDVVESYIRRIDGLELVGRCENALQAFEILQNKQIDLLFLDIQMPKLDGIEFIKTLSHPPRVIFTTAYRDYAIDAFNLDAVDYLLKPIPFTRFLKAVSKAFQQLNLVNQVTPVDTTGNNPANINKDLNLSGMEYIFVRADKKMVKVYLHDITYIESLKDYVIIHVPDKRIVTKQKISYLEEKLPEEVFLRIHRSFLVSIPRIEAFSPNHVEIGGKELPIGRSYKNVVSKILFINE